MSSPALEVGERRRRAHWQNFCRKVRPGTAILWEGPGSLRGDSEIGGQALGSAVSLLWSSQSLQMVSFAAFPAGGEGSGVTPPSCMLNASH